MLGKLCVCGHEMKPQGKQTLEMNGSSLGSNLWTDHVEVDMYICSWCGRMAFFEPEDVREKRFRDACEEMTMDELRAIVYDANPDMLRAVARERIEELESIEPASETPKTMEQLELAYLDARSDANINQLLLIPCVILDFLCIHPFRDGNGRMSRLLSLLLLYKNGFDAGKYVSFEEQINNYKAYYYEALQQSSAGWETNENSYFPFIENFLSTLYMCYKELDKRFAVVHGKKLTKKARVEATVLNSLTPLSKAEICKILPDVSPTTVEAVLGAMVKTGSVKRIGAGRTTRYIKA